MEKHQTEFKEAIENTPIIPAIKDAESLEQCLKSDACVIFILFGDICNLQRCGTNQSRGWRWCIWI